MDNFHAGNSSMDDWTSHNLWPWRDAFTSGVGHNFDRDELCLPANIIELTKDLEAEQRRGTYWGAEWNYLHAHP